MQWLLNWNGYKMKEYTIDYDYYYFPKNKFRHMIELTALPFDTCDEIRMWLKEYCGTYGIDYVYCGLKKVYWTFRYHIYFKDKESVMAFELVWIK